MQRLTTNILFVSSLIFTNIVHGSEPAKPVAQPPPTELVITMPWLGNLTDKDIVKFQSFGKSPVKIEHPSFSASVPKGWSVAHSGAYMDFEEAVSIRESQSGVSININLDYRNRLGFAKSLKNYGKDTATDISLGGKKVKMFTGGAGRIKTHFFETKNYDVHVHTILHEKKLDSKVEAELSSILSSLRLK